MMTQIKTKHIKVSTSVLHNFNSSFGISSFKHVVVRNSSSRIEVANFKSLKWTQLIQNLVSKEARKQGKIEDVGVGWTFEVESQQEYCAAPLNITVWDDMSGKELNPELVAEARK